ncbi:Spy/CpxP family protein refolding chaperone [Thiorhodococcus minor]|uniref:Spy/CpxP family protein refolding chaperone n=1 Tax=Thiorhodococcus minor TaxID=57489 RepID=A0A6M0JT26_9GAMM|nr:Spy/CpxP family protein refolding chaperone [Thiorhodococcus minor]NEV60642.1 hypothetical protein [Thiorhodococcus minor]
MKQQTRKLLGILTVSALALGVGNGVYARGGYGPDCYGTGPDGAPRAMDGRGGPMRGFGGPMDFADPEATAKRLDALKTSLGITPEQEQAWSDYATAMTTRAALMSGHREARLSGDLTAEQIEEFRQSSQTQRDRMQTARFALLAALTPEQRAQAGQLMRSKQSRGRGFGGPKGFADPAARAQRLDQLKTSLGITPEQEPAWSKYAEAVTARDDIIRSRREARLGGSLTPEQMDALRESRQSQREQMWSARQELYAALTPDQRAEAARLLSQKRGHGGRW